MKPSEPSSNKIITIIDVESQISSENPIIIDDQTTPIRKSCFNPLDPLKESLRAVKKSSVSAQDIENSEEIDFRDATLYYQPLNQEKETNEKPSKYIKIEKETKAMRVKRTEDQMDKVSNLLKMKNQFNGNKKNEYVKDEENIDREQNQVKEDRRKFKAAIAEVIECFEEASIDVLEQKLKEFLRKNSSQKLNSYSFEGNTKMSEAFGCEHILYQSLKDFVFNNTFDIYYDS